MKVAFWPGCVSKGACPELYVSTQKIAPALGLELLELWEASCTGAGVLSEQNPPLADSLNGLTLAMAERQGATLTTTVKHLLWILVEDIGLDKIRSLVKRKLTGLKIAPFYGCYILRPQEYLGLKERPERSTYLEQLIDIVGGEAVEYKGKTKCCGFPMVTMNRDASLTMGANHILEAKEKGADLLVTPCPLCHLNLDAQQPDAAR